MSDSTVQGTVPGPGSGGLSARDARWVRKGSDSGGGVLVSQQPPAAWTAMMRPWRRPWKVGSVSVMTLFHDGTWTVCGVCPRVSWFKIPLSLCVCQRAARSSDGASDFISETGPLDKRVRAA